MRLIGVWCHFIIFPMIYFLLLKSNRLFVHNPSILINWKKRVIKSEKSCLVQFKVISEKFLVWPGPLLVVVQNYNLCIANNIFALIYYPSEKIIVQGGT